MRVPPRLAFRAPDDDLEWAEVLGATEDIVSLIAADRRQLWVSPALQRVLGYTDVPPSFPAGYVHPEDARGLIEAFDRMVAAHEPSATAVYRIRHADGTWRRVEARGRNLLADPRIRAVLAITRDITDRHAAGASRSQALPGWNDLEALARMMQQAPQPSVVHCDGRVRWANRAAAELFELDAENGTGRPLSDFIPPESAELVRRRIAAVLGDGSAQAGEVVLQTASKRPIVVETRATLTTWEGRPAVHLALWDVTERRARTEQLVWSSTHDALTGLPNRILLADRLRSALATLRLRPAGVWVLFIDLDGYKAVNDNLGHLAGDDVLRTIARRLAEAVRTADVIARYGGDEFVAVGIGPADSLERAAEITAQRLRAAVAEPVALGAEVVSVTASIGWATTCDPDADPVDLLRAADHGAYRAKGTARRPAEAT